MIYGVDTSYANGLVDWKTAQESGLVQWAYARCCYGSDAWDDDGASYTLAHDQCKALKIPFSSYMFYCGWEDGYGQAQHFLDVANGRYGTNAVIIDVEEGSFINGGDQGVEQNIARLAACLGGIEKVAGQTILYTTPNTWATYFGNTDAFAGHRFLISHFTGVPGHFITPGGVQKVVGHQFSNGVIGAPPWIPGLSRPDNRGDRDICFNLADLVR